MTETDAVLAANLDFYGAFTRHDVPAMERLWARSVPVLCTHPGWEPLIGREAVMASWRNILSNPDAPHAMCHDEVAILYGALALVTCEEELGGGHFAATNLFIKEEGAWRLVHHQSGPILARESPAPSRRMN